MTAIRLTSAHSCSSTSARTHARRGDVAVHALASVGLCLCWFNPLAYVALALLRVDQELACDAAVLARRVDARRCYADALLKTQLASESAWRAPIGCRWQSSHPLKERIAMLKKPPPGLMRRVAGPAFIAILTGAASYVAWAGQPTDANNPPILVDMKVTITEPATNDVRMLATRYVVRSGEVIKDANGNPLDYSCTPYLTDPASESTAGKALATHGIHMRPGQILLDCSIVRDGRVVEKPVLLVADGQWGTIETNGPDGQRRYRIAIRPSTSAEDIEAAKETPPPGFTKDTGPGS